MQDAMTPTLLFLYMLAVAGGIVFIGVSLLVLFVLYVFVRGLMMQGEDK